MLRAVEVVLVNASVLALPPSQRAAAIVYDGTEDLELWRPPGPDRELLQAYGENLGSVLDKERAQLPRRRLKHGAALRVHPGKLRCDYLIWVAGRPEHGDDEPAPAPGLDALPGLVTHALDLAAKHGTLRVAFGALGAGRGAAEAAERMAATVRATQAYAERCLARGEATPIEEVLICAPSAADVAKAKRLTARLARHASPEPVRTAPASSARPSAPRTPSTPSSARRGKPKLDPNQLALARSHAGPYDRTQTYATADWLMHPTFGPGQVQLVQGPERMITVLFADGQERKLIHQR